MGNLPAFLTEPIRAWQFYSLFAMTVTITIMLLREQHRHLQSIHRHTEDLKTCTDFIEQLAEAWRR